MKDTEIPVPSGPEMPSVKEAEAETAEDTADNQGQPREYMTRRRRMWDWISGRHGHIRDWLVAGFTLALTIATIFYVHYAGQQRDAMIEAVKESKRASDAAEKAVEIAEQTRRDSERIATETTERAERATRATEKVASATTESANAARDAARAARQAMIIGTRPYIGIDAGLPSFNPDQFAETVLTVFNEGNTPTNVWGETKFVFTKGEIPIVNYADAVPFGEVEVLQHKSNVEGRPGTPILVKSAERVTNEQADGTGRGNMRLFLYGRLWYTGLGGPYPPIEFFKCYPHDSPALGYRFEDDCREKQRETRHNKRR
jgi:hypothetical protein